MQEPDPFSELPARLFLDSCTLQVVEQYGGFIWENEELHADDRIHRVNGGYEELEALRNVFLVAQRGGFEFAISEHSLVEVQAKGDHSYLRWAYDVMQYWQDCLSEYEGSPFSPSAQLTVAKLDGPQFGYLSQKDRLLLRDALLLDCSAFLTVEHRLPRNAHHVRKELGIRILRPSQYWTLLMPWARLYV